MRMNAQKRRREGKGAAGFVIGLIILAAVFGYYKWKKRADDGDKPTKTKSTSRLVSGSNGAPLFSLGGTIDGFLFSVSVDSEWTITLETGAGLGKLGTAVPVIRFATKDFSCVFMPEEEFNPTASLALTKHRAIKWSGKDGFGRDVGLELSTLKGKLIFGVSTDSSNLTKLPVALGQLTFGKDSLTFIPGNTLPSSSGLSSSARKFVTLDKGEWKVKSLSQSGELLPNEALSRLLGTTPEPLPPEPPPHVIRSRFLNAWYPETGYTWLDGTTGFRFFSNPDLKAQWKPGLASLLSPHIHTSTTEGVWEPDPGYNWDTLVTGWSGTVKWTPGLTHPYYYQRPEIRLETRRFLGRRPEFLAVCRVVDYYPNVIASPVEGQWMPAAGYRWATDDITDLKVAPLNSG